MKKFLIILFFISIYIVGSNVLSASPPIQQDCGENFNNCMNDAEVAYYTTVSVIQGSEEKAQRNYVASVRSCVSGYNDCPQQ